MQYLLTQQEYDELTERHALEIAELKNKLTELSKMVVTEYPCAKNHKGELVPYLCARYEVDHYCDSCPVLDYCCEPRKIYSK